jgi:DNA-binding transcriptional ArsR family regulator
MEATLKVLAERHRREIVDMLLDRPRSVGELMDGLGISQPRTSKHLAVLREAGLVTARKDAQRRIYELRPEPLQEVDAWLQRYRRLWAGRLDAPETSLDER